MTRQTRIALEVGVSLAAVAAVVGVAVFAMSKPAAAASPGGGSRPPGVAPNPFAFQKGERYQLTFTLPAGTVRGAQVVSAAIQQAFSSNVTQVNGVASSTGSSFVTTVDWTGATQTMDLTSSFPGMIVAVADMGVSPGAVSTTATLVPGTQRQIVFPGTTLTVAAPTGGTITLRHLVGARVGTSINAPTDSLPPFTTIGQSVYTYSWLDANGAGQSTTFTVVVS